MFYRLPLHTVWNELVFADSPLPISQCWSFDVVCAMTTFVIKRFVKFVVVSPPSFDCWFFSFHTNPTPIFFFLVRHEFNLSFLVIHLLKNSSPKCEDVECKRFFDWKRTTVPTKELGRLLKTYWIPVSSSFPHSLLPSFQFLSSYYQDDNKKVKFNKIKKKSALLKNKQNPV